MKDNTEMDTDTYDSQNYQLFLNWKKNIDSEFYKITNFHLDDIPDLPYYDYFINNIKTNIVIEIAVNNIL